MNRHRIVRLSLLCALSLSFHGGALAQRMGPAAKPTESAAMLQARLKRHIEQKQFAHAQWGIKVVSLDTGKVLFEHNADKLMKPASNAKMYSGALALDRLGPDYRIKTSFYADEKPDGDGVIHGDLIVYGRGDPSFAARFNEGDTSKSLQPVVDALCSAGIKRVDGDLVADESYFRGPPFGTDWAWDDLQYWYGAPFSALTVEDNVIDLVFKPGLAVGEPCQIITKPETTFVRFVNWTKTAAKGTKANVEIHRPVGENVAYAWGNVPMGSNYNDSVSVHNPAMWFVTLLNEALAKRGVTVSGKLRSVNWLDRETSPLDCSKMHEVASVESRPMVEIVKRMMKPSQNLYAHLLLLQVGVKSQDPKKAKTQFTEDAGLAEMDKFLREVGIEKNTVLLEEGSGLSRGCLLTPSASVKLLTYMTHHRCAREFDDALPIAGVDGTLRSRFKGTAAEKNVHAKTGTIRYVNTISGYLATRGNERLVFSVMLNNYKEGKEKNSGRVESDKVVRMLAEFEGHSK